MSERQSKLNSLQVDQKLELAESRKVAEAVKRIPEDELSMAWRSELNAKLSASVRARRRRFLLARPLGWAAGLGLSALVSAVLIVFMLPVKIPQTGSNSTETLESQLLAAHKTSVSSADIAGEGLSYLDETETISSSREPEWQKEDLEPL
jgi:hypothetical protein